MNKQQQHCPGSQSVLFTVSLSNQLKHQDMCNVRHSCIIIIITTTFVHILGIIIILALAAALTHVSTG